METSEEQKGFSREKVLYLSSVMGVVVDVVVIVTGIKTRGHIDFMVVICFWHGTNDEEDEVKLMIRKETQGEMWKVG